MKKLLHSCCGSLFGCVPILKHRALSVLVLGLCGLPFLGFADSNWTGDTSQDWNNAANWSSDPANPSGNFFINPSVPGTHPCLGANSAFTPADIIIGDRASAMGRLDHWAGSLALAVTNNNGNWFFVARGANTASAVYNLADTMGTGGTLTGFAQGSGSLTVGKLFVGGGYYANGGVGTANFNTTGSIIANSTQNFSGQGNASIVVACGTGASGTLNLDAGTVTAAGEVWVGNMGSGIVNQMGGTVNVGGLLLLARNLNNAQAGTGTWTISGTGSLNVEGDLVVAHAGNSSAAGTLNINAGGTVNVATTTKRWLILNQWDSAQGQLNLNGGTLNLNANTDLRYSTGSWSPGASVGPSVVNLNSGAITSWSGNQTGTTTTGVIDLNNNGGAGVSNTFNLNGGTLTINQIITGSDNGTVAFNFNGGTLKAAGNNNNFLQLGGASQTVFVKSGGAVIDSAGFNVAIPQGLVDAGGGHLTKLGNGTLTLSGANTYSGPTVVNQGRLVITPPYWTGMGSVTVANGASFGVTLPFNYSHLDVPNLTLGTSSGTTLDFDLGAFGNLTLAPLSILGTLTLNGPVTVNIADALPQMGMVPLLDYVGPKSGAGWFVLGSLPAGVQGTLVDNGTGRVYLEITGIGLPRWQGLAGATWDVNATTNWIEQSTELPTVFQNGVPALFDDRALGSTTVNLVTNVLPASVTITNDTASYTIAGAGSIAGAASLAKQGINTLSLLTANNYTGGTVVSGGALIIADDRALGDPSGGVTLAGGALLLSDGMMMASSRAITVTADSAIGVGEWANAQLSGVISGSGSLTKIGTGVLTLLGNNTHTGPLLLSAGTTELAGTASPGSVTVGNVPGDTIFNIGGNLTANNLFVGNVNGAMAVARLWGGTVNLAGGTGDNLSIGNWSDSYGYFVAWGGILNVNGISIGGEENPNVWPPQGTGDGILEVNGATINNTGWLVLARGAGPNTGILNMFSGSLTFAGGGLNCNWGANQTSIINVMGGSLTSTNQGVNFRTANTGIVNLNNGLLQATSLTGRGTLNFDGGTLRPAPAFTSPFLNLTGGAYIYGGGATIDDNGLALTISQPLLAPTAYGVSAISFSLDSAGYIAPPIVTITGGSGSNATAIAISGGSVAEFTVTSPGTGYGAGDVLTVNFSGGGAGASPPSLVTVSLTPNTSGGLTKAGTGTLTLAGANTYTGLTTVASGELFLTPAHQAGGPVTVADGAKFGILSNSKSDPPATIGNLTLGSSGATTLDFSYGFAGNPTNAALRAGIVAVHGTATVRLAGDFAVGAFPVLNYSSLSSLPALVPPRGVAASLSNDTAHATLYVVVSSVWGGIVWTGTNSVAPNLWDVNTTENWLTGNSPTPYLETLPPGDAVTFNDVGSGIVMLSNPVSPLSVTISNDSKSYSFTGPGRISGGASLTKRGANAATLNFTGGNDYTGPTAIAGGTLVATGNAIGDASAVTLSDVPGAALNVTAPETIGSLAGGGATGGNVVLNADLTTGGNNASTTFGGAITGNSSFAMQGRGTLTLTGRVNVASQIQVGNGAGSTAVLDIGPGASVTASNWWVVGINGGAGTVNINGGALVHVGAGHLTLGTQGTTPTGTINLHSGSISNLAGETFLGEGSAEICYGNYHQYGGTAYLGTLRVGRGDWGGSGIGRAVIEGGTVTVADLDIGYGNNNTHIGTNVMAISSGATVNATGFVRLAFAGSSSLWGVLTNTGGTLNVGATALYLGYWDPCSARISLGEGGEINLRNHASIVFGQNYNHSGTCTFDQHGGSVTFYSDDGMTVGGTGSLNLGNAGSGTYGYNLMGGTLTVPQIRRAGGPGTGTFNFQGGTLKAAASSTTFMQGLTAANVMAGGAIIDNNGFDITIAQPLLDGDGGSGGLVIQGAGTLNLDGLNSYTGGTWVNGGTLGGTGRILGAVWVESGAALAPGNSSIGTFTVGGNVGIPGAVIMEVNRNDGVTTLADLLDAPVIYMDNGTLVLTNIGAPLQVGDTFHLFKGSVNYVGSPTLDSRTPGQAVVWDTSNLKVDGTIRVANAVNVPFRLAASVTGSTITFSWPSDQLGLRLVTNAVSLTDSTAWFTYPGSTQVTSVNVAIDPAQTNVFFRLVFP